MTHLLFRFRQASHGRSRRAREEALLLVPADFCFSVFEVSSRSAAAVVFAGGVMTGRLLAIAELAILMANATMRNPSTNSLHRSSRRAFQVCCLRSDHKQRLC